ncbi:MAG: BTAD domain-containing putative transcriptional regulator [Desulfovibrionales bacterium]
MDKKERFGTGLTPSYLVGKYQPPLIRESILRWRLFSFFDNFTHTPLLWISGPSGAGKTTLVKTYLDSHDLPFFWYRMDSGDSDLSSFFYYLGKAVRAKVTNPRRIMPLLTPEYVLGITTFTRRFFEALFANVAPPVVFVFDNYQEVPDDAPLQDVMRVGLEWIPEGVAFVFISRRMPPPAFARLFTIHSGKILHGESLAFSESETRELARMRTVDLSDQALKDLHLRTRGWAAGLVLLMETQGVAEDGAAVRRETPEVIFDYFAGEIFDRAAPHIQDFLMKTCFLPSLTIADAQLLTGERRAGEIFEYLHRNNLFTEKHGAEEPVYRYHPLLLEFLTKRARDAFPTEKLKEVKQRSATILVDQDPDAGAQLFREIEDWEGLETLILTKAEETIQQGRFSKVEHWISMLPPNLRNRSPRVLYWYGMAMQPFRPDAAMRYLQRAYTASERGGDAQTRLMSWCGIVETLSSTSQHFSCLEQWIERFECQIPHECGDCPEDILVRAACAMTMALILRSKAESAIAQWETAALGPGPNSTVLLSQVQLLTLRVHQSLWKGQVEGAFRYLAQLKKWASSPTSPIVVKIQHMHAESVYALATGDHPGCIRAVGEGIFLSRSSGIRVQETTLMCHAALSSLNRGDCRLAEEYLAQTEDHLHDLNPWEESYRDFTRARLELIRGNYDAGLRYGVLALEGVKKIQIPFALGSVNLLLAILREVTGNHHQAQLHIRCVRRTAGRMNSPVLSFMALMTQALFALQHGRSELCRSLLQNALRLGRKQGMSLYYVDRPADTARLLAFALEEGIEPGYVRKMIRCRMLVPEEPPVEIQEWPWEYRIITLGGFELKRKGKTLRPPGKATRKPLHLLKVLIALGAKSVPEHQLIEGLWPDSEGDAAHSAFTTTLSRLRKILGNEKVLILHDRRLTLDPSSCWVDVWAFERDVEHGLRPDADSADRVARLTRAVSLYRGSFLEGEEQDWLILKREQLKRRFEQAVCSLAGHYERLGHYETAVEVYERALDREDALESLYQGLMQNFGKMDRPNSAVAVYHRCRKALAQKLHTLPSEKTRAIKKALS